VSHPVANWQYRIDTGAGALNPAQSLRLVEHLNWKAKAEQRVRLPYAVLESLRVRGHDSADLRKSLSYQSRIRLRRRVVKDYAKGQAFDGHAELLVTLAQAIKIKNVSREV
jgi:hypothetical protein